MASTAIEIKVGDEIQKLLFTTAPSMSELQIIAVTIYQCNDEFVPIRKLQDTIDKRTEEQYHKELRKESATKEQFRKQYSTNPEWNED